MMKSNDSWLDWAVELQSLAQAGLYYGHDKYDRERYQRVRDIAAEMLASGSGASLDRVQELFCCETGYQTPKLDCRAVVIEDGKILLVREENGLWSIPGGWVDANLSVAENTVKEAKEEAGLDVRPERVIALHDKDRRNPPAHAFKICKVFVLCSVLGGEFQPNLETTESGYFAPDALPELCTEKNTREQIEMCFEAYRTPDWKTALD